MNIIKIKTVFFIPVIFIFLLFSCEQNTFTGENIKLINYECDAETKNNTEELFIDKNNKNVFFKGANLQNKIFAHSGEYSIKLNEKQSFGFTTTIKNVDIETRFKISVWRKKDTDEDNGVLIVSSEKKCYYFKQTKVSKIDKKGWELLELIVTIPPNARGQNMKVYVWQQAKGDVYFDDFKIEQLPPKVYPEYSKIFPLTIYLDTLKYLKLLEIREQAFNKGVLETTDDSWVKSVIFSKTETYKAKIRLKGDWLDHLKGKKWSFRIKIKKKNAWNGMKVFSIQNPEARYFLYEWVAHKMLEKEDVLTTRYGFVPVRLNNKSLGIYAYEEHFEKQLLESKKRREGVILKLNEDAFWVNSKKKVEDGRWYNLPLFEASIIEAFGGGKIRESQNLKEQFAIAQNLLYEYKWNLKSASEVFDVDKLAKFYAITDVTQMYHGMRWHNQRFYYNPVISKLEIIGYDGYGGGVYTWFNSPIMGNFKVENVLNIKSEGRINYNPFTDSVFVEKYIQYLEEYSSEEYISSFFNEIEEELLFTEELIKKEYEDYNYDTNFLFESAKIINDLLPEYKNKVSNGLYEQLSYNNKPKEDYKEEYNKDMIPYYMHVYKENNNEYRITNYYPLPVEIIGLGEKEKSYSDKITENTNIGAYNSENNIVTIKSDIKAKYLFVRVKDQNNIISVPIIQWESPKATTPLQELLEANVFPESKLYTVVNKKVIFKGKHKTSENIIIPEGYKVIFEEGTELDFTKKSLFLSYSPVFFNGTENNKIIIKSSDGTAMGFSVFQANKKSVLENVIFDNFNTLNYKGWILTGAINFYESEIEIKNTTFKNNNCEDALNIIRSDFYVYDCYFENIFSDAFDSDFCTGRLESSKFEKIGNDAIDFSGSRIKISDCEINNVGDKGISGGEQSYLTIKNCSVSVANIGYASKDKSEIELINCKVTNSQYALVALQKKPEYGAATIKTSDFSWQNIITLHLIEKKSNLNLNGKNIEGTEKNVAKRFY